MDLSMYDDLVDFNDSDEPLEDNFANQFPELIDQEEEPYIVEEDVRINPFSYASTTYYAFPQEAYLYMLQCLAGRTEVSAERILAVDPRLGNLGEPIQGLHDGVLKKWKALQNELHVNTSIDNVDWLTKAEEGVPSCSTQDQLVQSLRIPPIEQWENIVRESHENDGGIHLGINKSINSIKAKNWVTGAQGHGIPRKFIEDFIKHCRQCKIENVRKRIRSSPRHKRKTFQYTSFHEVDVKDLQAFLVQLSIDHKVVLRVLRDYEVATHPFPATITIFRCHRDGRHRKRMKLSYDNAPIQREQRSTKQKCGCEFTVKVIEPISNNDSCEQPTQKAHIYSMLEHKNHTPGSDNDMYFLPIHYSALVYCTEFLTNLNDHQAALSASRRIEKRLAEEASPEDRATCRFFLTPKDVSNLAWKLAVGKAVSTHDWTNVHNAMPKWLETRKIIFFQAYNPSATIPEKRPFIVVIQDDWMRELAKNISKDSAWVIDSTFKTNMYGFPLYAGMCPNKEGYGMPIYLMICSNDVGSRQETMALQICLTEVFKRMDNVRPNALVIDKSKMEYNAFMGAIDQDPYCWEGGVFGGVQIRCKIITCHFHAKKNWVEKLKSKVSRNELKEDVYATMCRMLSIETEESFDKLCADFDIEYANEEKVLRYVHAGWTSKECPWRSTWPMWGRRFPHGFQDTTNLVERLWHFVKYTLLHQEVNRRLYALIEALIGNPETGVRFGGNTLLEHFKARQGLSASGKFSKRGVDKTHTRRLYGAKHIEDNFIEDPQSILEVIDEFSGDFRMKSETNDEVWYNISLSTGYCDCPDLRRLCKHMIALRNIIDRQLEGVKDLLPPMEIYEDTINTEPLDLTNDAMILLNSTPPTNFTPPSIIPLSDMPSTSSTPPTISSNDMPSISHTIPMIQENRFLRLLNRDDKIRSYLTQDKLSNITPQQFNEIDSAHSNLHSLLISIFQPIPEPQRISMPRVGSSIRPIQYNVTKTRFGFNLPPLPTPIESQIDPTPQVTKGSQQRQLIAKKHKRINLPKLFKKTCLQCGDHNLIGASIEFVDCGNCGCVVHRIDPSE